MILEKEDLESLRSAKEILENPNLAAKITAAIGTPIEKVMKLLPKKWSKAISDITKKSLEVALKGSLFTLKKNIIQKPINIKHKLAVVTTGALGGIWGFPSLAVELPISTTIMLRSIADIARSEGEDLREPEVQLNCLSVFAIGGRSPKDDAAESGYYTIRVALAKVVTEAAEFIAERGLVKEGAPAILRFITSIANRFGIAVTEKAASQSIPLIGAAGGATINYIFINHFQNMAKGHFTVRRLERKYGPAIIETEYNKLDVKLLK